MSEDSLSAWIFPNPARKFVRTSDRGVLLRTSYLFSIEVRSQTTMNALVAALHAQELRAYRNSP